MYLYKNIFYDPSLEPSHRDGSNEGSQHMFLFKNKKIIFELSSIPPQYLLLSGTLPIFRNFREIIFVMFISQIQDKRVIAVARRKMVVVDARV